MLDLFGVSKRVGTKVILLLLIKIFLFAVELYFPVLIVSMASATSL